MKLLVLICAFMTWELGLAGPAPEVPFQCSEYLDVVAVIDGSDSILPPQFEVLKDSLAEFAKTLLTEASKRVFGVVVFSAGVTETVELSGDLEELLPAIKRLRRPADGTDTDKGILEMTKMLTSNHDRKDVPKVGVVITDGMSKNRTLTEEAALMAQEKGINVFAVGVTNHIDRNELDAIASSPENVVTFDTFEEMYAQINGFVRKMCIVHGGWSEWSNDSLSECSVTCGDGFQKVRMARRCDNPPPSGGGRDCNGSSTQTELQPCNRGICDPIHGRWGPWSDPTVSSCPVACGQGLRSAVRHRSCDSPPPSNGGRDCGGDDTMEYSTPCNGPLPPCEVNLCSDCKYENGVAYFPHPDPKFFYQCVRGHEFPIPRRCGSGTVWSQIDLTCIAGDPETSNVCDALFGETGTGYLPIRGQPQMYIRCVNGDATYEVCPEGYVWDPENPPCSRRIITETTQEPCRLTAIEGNPTAYHEHVDGFNTPFTMPCAPGTVFNQEKCGCGIPVTPVSSCPVGMRPHVGGDSSKYEQFVHGNWISRDCPHGTTFVMPTCKCLASPLQNQVQECTPEIKLEFENNDAKDTSGNWYWVQKHDVTFTGGYASFKDKSFLRITRFSNMDFLQTLTISFSIRGGNSGIYPQAVITNADCDIPGSIIISLYQTALVFDVDNKADVRQRIVLPFDARSSDTGMTRVSLVIARGLMTASVGNIEFTKPFSGDIRKVHCGLQIGQGTGLQHFQGDLDDIKIYLCEASFGIPL